RGRPPAARDRNEPGRGGRGGVRLRRDQRSVRRRSARSRPVNAARPRPDPVAADDARFWAYVAAGELRIQRCAACGTYRHPPRPVCAVCGSTAQEWVPASGRGEVWAATVIHSPTLPPFTARTPYGAVVVRLEEGVFLVGNVLDCPPGDVAIGLPVEVAITEVEAGARLPPVPPARPGRARPGRAAARRARANRRGLAGARTRPL